MERIVEFKIEYMDLPWEKIPVAFEFDLSDKSFEDAVSYADELALRMCRATGKTIRWEFQGVGQGHYTNPFWAQHVELS
jgi:hypothetical protein